MVCKKILAVDDDDVYRQLYRRILANHPDKFSFHGVSSGQQALKYLSKNPCDCLILDLVMPGLSGFEVLSRIRSTLNLKTLPILIVTGCDNEDDTINALRLGADDYITKPFSIPLFEAKMTRLFRRLEDSSLQNKNLPDTRKMILRAGPLKIDRINNRVYVCDKPVALSEKEFDLLHCLMRRAPGLARWSDIHTEVWGCPDTPAYTKASSNLLVTLFHLKSKLGIKVASMISVQKGTGLRLETHPLSLLFGIFELNTFYSLLRQVH